MAISKAKEINTQLSGEEIQIANKHLKLCSRLLVIRKMKLKVLEILPHPNQNGDHLEKRNSKC